MAQLIKKLSLPVFILFFLLCTTKEIISYDIKNNKTAYVKLIRSYTEWLEVEGRVFSKLSFQLSSSQPIKKGYSAKLILEDNLGRKWIFKPAYPAEHFSSLKKIKGPIIVYRLYKLFGLPTPQIHYVTLDINDKKIPGNIQEFIANKGSLSGVYLSKIAASGLDYLLKTHVIDWMVSNYDAGVDNFLVLSLNAQGQPEKIMRIDNTSDITLFNKDMLKYDWRLPGQKKPYTKYYNDFWKNYALKKIQLDITGNYLFIKFISEFPDDFVEKIIIFSPEYGLKQAPLNESIQIKADRKYLLQLIASKKHTLLNDFKEFYSNLAQERNEPLSLNEDSNIKRTIDAVTIKIGNDIKKLKKEERKIIESSANPSKIDAVFSLEGFIYLEEVYRAYWQNKKANLGVICESALKKLACLKTSTKNQNEIKAIEIYSREINKICSGHAPTFNRDEINTFVANFIIPTLLEKD